MPVRTAPPLQLSAAPQPAAVPARSGRIETARVLLLGMVRPLPKPTKIVAPKKAIGETMPDNKTISPTERARKATSRPLKISVCAGTRRARRPVRKLPAMKPPVMLPM